MVTPMVKELCLKKKEKWSETNVHCMSILIIILIIPKVLIRLTHSNTHCLRTLWHRGGSGMCCQHPGMTQRMFCNSQSIWRWVMCMSAEREFEWKNIQRRIKPQWLHAPRGRGWACCLFANLSVHCCIYRWLENSMCVASCCYLIIISCRHFTLLLTLQTDMTVVKGCSVLVRHKQMLLFGVRRNWFSCFFLVITNSLGFLFMYKTQFLFGAGNLPAPIYLLVTSSLRTKTSNIMSIFVQIIINFFF